MPELKEKTLTMEELKTELKNTLKESELAKTIENLKEEVKVLKQAKIETDPEAKFKDAKDFVSALCHKDYKKVEEISAKAVEKLGEKAVSSETSSFGYTVPTELADAILEKKDKIAKIRKYAMVFKMSGKFQLPTEGTAVTAYWVAENEEVTESDPTVGKKDLDDYYLAARVLMPYKLLDTSAVNITNYISTLCSRALRNKEETAFVAGDGSGKPTGIRQASVGSIAQEGASLAYDDIVNLFFEVKEQYRTEGIFLTSTAGIKLIKKLKDADNMPIYDPRDQTLFNRPLVESEDIPSNLGTGGNETEIWYGDFNNYWIKDGVSMQAETDKIIAKLQIELVLHQSVDGVLVFTDPVKKLTGVK